MTRRYSNTAVETTLSSGVTAVATTIPVSSTTGLPAVDFILALDADEATQELVLVTGIAGTNLTVVRGYDNTTAVSHSAGAVVRHSHAAIDFRESRDHEAATTGVHGVSGSVVGTTEPQALTNKDLTVGNTFPATLATDADLTDHDVPAAHGVGVVVGTTEVQTLTNKTLTDPVVTATSGWTAYVPVLTNWSLGNGTLTGRYYQVGGLVHFSIKLTAGATTTFTGNPLLTVPVAPDLTDVFAKPVGTASLADASSSSRGTRAVVLNATPLISLRGEAGDNLSATAPWTWAVSDTIEITGAYEAAV